MKRFRMLKYLYALAGMIFLTVLPAGQVFSEENDFRTQFESYVEKNSVDELLKRYDRIGKRTVTYNTDGTKAGAGYSYFDAEQTIVEYENGDIICLGKDRTDEYTSSAKLPKRMVFLSKEAQQELEASYRSFISLQDYEEIVSMEEEDGQVVFVKECSVKDAMSSDLPAGTKDTALLRTRIVFDSETGDIRSGNRYLADGDKEEVLVFELTADIEPEEYQLDPELVSRLDAEDKHSLMITVDPDSEKERIITSYVGKGCAFALFAKAQTGCVYRAYTDRECMKPVTEEELADTQKNLVFYLREEPAEGYVATPDDTPAVKTQDQKNTAASPDTKAQGTAAQAESEKSTQAAEAETEEGAEKETSSEKDESAGTQQTEAQQAGTQQQSQTQEQAQAEQQAEAAPSYTELPVTPLAQDAYVKASSLNVRSGSSTYADSVGSLSYGERVWVTGEVWNDGVQWYRISYGGGEGYIAADYMTSEDLSSYSSSSQPEMVQCDYCGNWFEAGTVFRNHVCPARDAALSGDYSYNDYGTDMPVYSSDSDGGYDYNYDYNYNEGAGYSGSNYNDGGEEWDLVYCEYCGYWYKPGSVFENHSCPARDAARGW